MRPLDVDVRSFRAMGSPCRIVVAGGSDELVEAAVSMIDDLEHRWSRFLPTSEISHLNRHAGDPVIVSDETFTLLRRASEARLLTGGRFNALMLLQLEQLGYRRPWQNGPPDPALCQAAARSAPATTDEIELVPDINLARLPESTAFDPGGIGKGLAADLVTEFLVESGATSTSVELGGDLRVTGIPWADTQWRIGVAHPMDRSHDIATLVPGCDSAGPDAVDTSAAGGAVATSSRLRRRWSSSGGEAHHLLDPTTGRPALTDIVAVTASSTVAWWAEVAAKVALMAGSALAGDLLHSYRTPGVIVTSDGVVHTTEQSNEVMA